MSKVIKMNENDIEKRIDFCNKYIGSEIYGTHPNGEKRFLDDNFGKNCTNEWYRYKNKNFWTNGCDAVHEITLFKSWIFKFCFSNLDKEFDKLIN